MRLAESIYHGFWSALDWIYPPHCVGCGLPGERLCPACFETIRFLPENICPVCGVPNGGSKRVCRACQQSPPPYDALRSLACYEGVVRESIHALKYEGNQGLGVIFSSHLADLVSAAKWEAHCVAPVPLSPFRQAARGYNQSALLARPVALRLGIPFRPFTLKRTRNTRSQVELSLSERLTNLVGAFVALPDLAQDQNILLVDDVTTTGATLRECAIALREAGAAKIYGLTLARPIAGRDFLQIEKPSSII